MPRHDRAGMACLVSLAGSALCGVAALVLAACTAPSSRMPRADEATRRPANSPEAVALQRCVGEGQARQQALSAALRRVQLAEHAATLAASRQALLARCESAAQALAQQPPMPAPNRVFTIPFATGSATLALDDAHGAELRQAVRQAAWVVVRGRTDARHDSAVETALAQRRARAAADLLQAWGVHGEHVRVQWQGAGDPAVARSHDRSDADTGARPATDRRVEIEVYARRPLYQAAFSGRVTAAAPTGTASSSAR